MGEKIFDFIKGFATGKHSKVFWGLVIVIIIFSILIFPYVDANFLYYDRIEKRIDNLTSLVALSGKPVQETPELYFEYESIIREIDDAQKKSIVSAMNNSSEGTFEYWAKFISGGALFALVGIICLCQKKKGVKYSLSFFVKNNLSVFILCIILASILAFLFSNIPTIVSIWINIIAAPMLQIVVMYLLFLQPKNN